LEPDVAQSDFDRSLGGGAASALVGVLTELCQRLPGAFHTGEQPRLSLTLPAHVLGSFDLTERCVETDDGSGLVEHLGGGGAYRNLMRVYPSSGRAVVMFGNLTNYAVEQLTTAVLSDSPVSGR